MKILVIGGTRFLGPRFVSAALARDHRVTLFNRGSRRLPELPGLRQLSGDRRSGLGALSEESFDAVLDTCAYHPADIAGPATELAHTFSTYCLVSTVSVYASAAGNLDESAELVAPPDPLPEVMTPETYGALKAQCERVAAQAFGDRLFVVRPGLIAGPGDSTHRFGYWVRRIARGGDIVAPGPPGAPVQFIDVRDLAAWILLAIEQGRSGTYTADGPGRSTTIAELLDECVATVGNNARLRWVDGHRLLELGVEPWTELPLWLPPDARGFLTFDSSKAMRDGLKVRPIGATIGAVRAWDRAHGPPEASVRTLTPEKEAEILADAGVRSG